MSKKLDDVVRRIGGMIIEIRGERVILDSDLAVLFGVTTKVRIPAKSATHSDFGRTLNPVISDTYRSVATLVD
ncbi:MAG: ORF6N domain-containing protein [bacterium]|jgi:hypothetical protein